MHLAILTRLQHHLGQAKVAKVRCPSLKGVSSFSPVSSVLDLVISLFARQRLLPKLVANVLGRYGPE